MRQLSLSSWTCAWPVRLVLVPFLVWALVVLAAPMLLVVLGAPVLLGLQQRCCSGVGGTGTGAVACHTQHAALIRVRAAVRVHASAPRTHTEATIVGPSAWHSALAQFWRQV